MPHYVSAPEKGKEMYRIFSTVVMDNITPPMGRAMMKKWLHDHDYKYWLDPTPDNERPEVLEQYASPSGRELLDKICSMMYWNGDFWYVTEEDGYFV